MEKSDQQLPAIRSYGTLLNITLAVLLAAVVSWTAVLYTDLQKTKAKLDVLDQRINISHEVTNVIQLSKISQIMFNMIWIIAHFMLLSFTGW